MLKFEKLQIVYFSTIEKIEKNKKKGAFHLAPVPLHNIPSFCKVNGAIIPVFLYLHYFYLRKP